jgi:hypothetical protein
MSLAKLQVVASHAPLENKDTKKPALRCGFCNFPYLSLVAKQNIDLRHILLSTIDPASPIFAF